MLCDAALQFSNAQAITSTAASTNIVDFTVPNGVDMGIGEHSLRFAIYCTAAFTTGNSATLQVQVQAAPNSSGSPGTYITMTETDALAASVLIINAKIPIDLTHRATGQALYRFIRLNYVVGTGTFSAGSITAFLVNDRDDNPVGQYASGYSVGS